MTGRLWETGAALFAANFGDARQWSTRTPRRRCFSSPPLVFGIKRFADGGYADVGRYDAIINFVFVRLTASGGWLDVHMFPIFPSRNHLITIISRPMKTPQNIRQTRIKPSFIASLSRSLALATLAAMGLGQADAANYTWDPTFDTGTTGGAGTWDTTIANWWDGAADVAWPNLTTDTAIFGGVAGGLVTINTGAGVNAGNLTFSTTGYTLAGNVPADVLTLGTGVVTVTNVADSATISAIIAGTTGLNKVGAGTLIVSGANTFTGGVSITGGTLSVGADAGLGAGANGVTIDGGALQATGIFTSARAVTLGAAGGTVNVTTGNNLTLSTALTANANELDAILKEAGIDKLQWEPSSRRDRELWGAMR